MATPAGQFHPGRLIGTFIAITAVLYALVFFTSGANTPKLGIDLQGGTRSTLTATTPDGSTPPRDSMAQARSIMAGRVNGSGVAGAQVQVDGSNQLVVTVPGVQNLDQLTRSALLNIRPQLAQGVDPSQAPPAPSGSAGVSGSPGASGSPGSAPSGAPTTAPAIGGSGAAVPGASGGASVGNAPGASAPGASAPAAGAPGASAPASGQGLQHVAAATVAAPAAPAPSGSASAASAPDASTGLATAVASNPATEGAPAASPVASGTPASTGAPGSSATSATPWPLAGSDPKNPNQPAAQDAAGWAAWEKAAQNAVSANAITCKELTKTEGLDDPARPLLACGDPAVAEEVGQVYLLDKTLIPGDHVSSAAANLDPSQGWVINLSFNSAGYSTWANYTTNNVGKQTAFTLDGKVLSSPRINGAITTTVTTVSGNFTQATATSLANSLKFGSLPLHFESANSEAISAQLGTEYLRAGLIAGGIGLLLVVLYCLIYYRLLGLITILSLLLSFGLVYAVMVLLGRWISLSLDMAGVAGLIVAIGITADSFVIYFERIKDEVREGRSFRSAVPRGWERAKRTILSADAVSLISAVVLYLVAVGDVKGFAFTLGLSTLLDLVVVYLITHPLVALASGAKVFSSPQFSGLGAVARAGAQQRAATARLTPKEA